MYEPINDLCLLLYELINDLFMLDVAANRAGPAAHAAAAGELCRGLPEPRPDLQYVFFFLVIDM